jgi:cell division protein FtsB
MTAPTFNSFNALTGDLADSPVLGILSTADHIHDAVQDAEQLREENAELHTRLQELEDELRELRDLHMLTVGELARARAVTQ